jgi:hypothetical protein
MQGRINWLKLRVMLFEGLETCEVDLPTILKRRQLRLHVPEFRDHFAGRKSVDLSVNTPTTDFTITLNPAGMYSLYTVVRVDTKYIFEFTVSQNVSYIFKNLSKFR